MIPLATRGMQTITTVWHGSTVRIKKSEQWRGGEIRILLLWYAHFEYAKVVW